MQELVALVIVGGLYVLPLIVAVLRSAPNTGAIVVINLLLGWTVIGWIVALAMACMDTKPKVHPSPEVQRWDQQNPRYWV